MWASRMNSDLPVSADALLAERARLEEELQASEDWRELLRLKSRKDRGEPMSAVNAARLELVLIDALSQDATFVRYKSVCVALERLIRGLPPFPDDATDEAPTDDNLTKIRGITPSMARRLNALDVTSFAQIAAWRGDDIRYISSELGIGKQISEQGWVAQAARLAGFRPERDEDRPPETRAEPPREAPRAMPAAKPPVPVAKEPPPAEVRTHSAPRPLSVVPAKPTAADAVSALPASEAKGETRGMPASKAPEPVAPAPVPEAARVAASSAVTPLVTQRPAIEAERPVAPPEAPKPGPAAAPPRPIAVETLPAPPLAVPSFDASLLKPPRPLVVTRASIAHLRSHETPSVLRKAAVSAGSVDDMPKAPTPPTPRGDESRAPVSPPKLPPATAAVLEDGSSKSLSSMSIAEAIAYATEVAQRKEKPDAQADVRVAPPPPAPPPPVQAASARKDVPAPPKSSPPPAAKRPSAPPPAAGANGAGRDAVAPPPLPADYKARAEEVHGADAQSYSGQDVGFSKGEIEEATVEIVHKGPAQMPTPRMVIRTLERDETSDTGRAATPIGRFLKALTGNQG